MGPRLDSRGRPNPWAEDRIPGTGFNGAAAGQPRKGPCGQRVPHFMTASMGPRLDSRGRPPHFFVDSAL